MGFESLQTLKGIVYGYNKRQICTIGFWLDQIEK